MRLRHLTGTLPKEGKLITSKEIADKFNISYPTVTHYTNMGFFTVVGKRGNKRLYDEDKVGDCLTKIKEKVNQGYPLRLIRDNLFKV
ncbi:MAG: MerR family transcriptional regulator [Candidatus Omnitrophota bacterium]|jgi:DNA-binding transcriptional MerR regulator